MTRPRTRAERVREAARKRQRRAEGVECAMHEWQKHGKEAEELRAGIEQILADFRDGTTGSDAEDFRDIMSDLQSLLDSVDARDSLAYRERRDG